MSKNHDLREKLYGKSIVKVGGAFDAMSAKLVESAGFDAVWAGSFAISATHALPDASILTMTEFYHVASTMADACEIPIIADCDTGYGGPNNVTHMVRKYENAGISSICIEDKIFCGTQKGNLYKIYKNNISLLYQKKDGSLKDILIVDENNLI